MGSNRRHGEEACSLLPRLFRVAELARVQQRQRSTVTIHSFDIRSSMTTIRVLPHSVADGPHNMAADEVLLESAASGVASLRFYGWTEATVSIGYFQPAGKQALEPQVLRLPLV